MTTLWALEASRALGRTLSSGDGLVAWLRACQLPGGAFTCQPKPEFGGVDDIAYVRSAVRALQKPLAELVRTADSEIGRAGSAMRRPLTLRSTLWRRSTRSIRCAR